MLTRGGVLSIFTAFDVNVALLPAKSFTTTLPVTLFPSAERMSGLATEVPVTPDRLSEVLNGKETFVLFQPAPLEAGFCRPNASVGGVLSMLMPDFTASTLVLP